MFISILYCLFQATMFPSTLQAVPESLPADHASNTKINKYQVSHKYIYVS